MKRLKLYVALLIVPVVFSSFTNPNVGAGLPSNNAKMTICSNVVNNLNCAVIVDINVYTLPACGNLCVNYSNVVIPPLSSYLINCNCNPCNIEVTVTTVGTPISPVVFCDYTSACGSITQCGATNICYTSPSFIIS